MIRFNLQEGQDQVASTIDQTDLRLPKTTDGSSSIRQIDLKLPKTIDGSIRPIELRLPTTDGIDD
jgi:hypothetical protein